MSNTINSCGTTGTGTIAGYSGTTLTGTDGCYITTTPGWATPLSGGGGTTIFSNGSDYTSISTAITNSNNMNKQVKVAVFTVERNKDNKVTSSKLYGEFWVEVKNGSSLDLAVAKELSKDFDPANTVIKELYSFTF